MTNLRKELGVQSYCFRGFRKNEEVIELVKRCGLDRVELCGVHADFTKEETFGEVVDLYKKGGVRIVSIGVQGLRGNRAVEEKYFKFLKAAGARHMSVDFSPQTLPRCFRVAEKLADKYDVKLAIHNHGGRHWLGCAAMLDYVFSRTSERIGLCLDTAWALDSGEDPVALVDRFGPRLYGLHLKDFTFDSARRFKDAVVGKGNLDLANLSKRLKAVKFSGFEVLEYEGDVSNPLSALKKCVKAVRAAF